MDLDVLDCIHVSHANEFAGPDGLLGDDSVNCMGFMAAPTTCLVDRCIISFTPCLECGDAAAKATLKCHWPIHTKYAAIHNGRLSTPPNGHATVVVFSLPSMFFTKQVVKSQSLVLFSTKGCFTWVIVDGPSTTQSSSICHASHWTTKMPKTYHHLLEEEPRLKAV